MGGRDEPKPPPGSARCRNATGHSRRRLDVIESHTIPFPRGTWCRQKAGLLAPAMHLPFPPCPSQPVVRPVVMGRSPGTVAGPRGLQRGNGCSHCSYFPILLSLTLVSSRPAWHGLAFGLSSWVREAPFARIQLSLVPFHSTAARNCCGLKRDRAMPTRAAMRTRKGVHGVFVTHGRPPSSSFTPFLGRKKPFRTLRPLCGEPCPRRHRGALPPQSGQSGAAEGGQTLPIPVDCA